MGKKKYLKMNNKILPVLKGNKVRRIYKCFILFMNWKKWTVKQCHWTVFNISQCIIKSLNRITHCCEVITTIWKKKYSKFFFFVILIWALNHFVLMKKNCNSIVVNKNFSVTSWNARHYLFPILITGIFSCFTSIF